MKIVFLVHSVRSCWNNGNAHFQRGVGRALVAAGHRVTFLEPADGWSRNGLASEAGPAGLAAFDRNVPDLGESRAHRSVRDALALLEREEPDLVIVHEWNEPELVNAIGTRRMAGGRFVLLFHDTHHRAVSRPEELARFDLSGFDGVLAFGGCIAEIYRRRGWGRRAWTWHEAADTRLFRPMEGGAQGDVVWVGNWGDGERSDELRRFLLEPVRRLGLSALVHGVRYPDEALDVLKVSGIRFGGWLPNHRVPEVFAGHRLTVHVPRRPYAAALPGVPTIRVFEALACGTPLVSAPWRDDEGLFPGDSFLMARTGEEMEAHLRAVLADRDLAAHLRATGLAAIAARHTCNHRAAELLAIHASLAAPAGQTREVRA